MNPCIFKHSLNNHAIDTDRFSPALQKTAMLTGVTPPAYEKMSTKAAFQKPVNSGLAIKPLVKVIE